MWSGSWDAAATVFTGVYTDAASNAWVGTVTVVDIVTGTYLWNGAWHAPGPPV